MKDKRIHYGYLFNYFGGANFRDKVIDGANININIRPYKDEKEVLFEEDDEVKIVTDGETYYLNDVFDVCFDRKKQFAVKRNLAVDNLFRLICGWDEIKYSVIGYEMTYPDGVVGDEMDGAPESFKNLPVSDYMSVSETEFREFLSAHAEDFDIQDNKHAQVPSVGFYDIPQREKEANK